MLGNQVIGLGDMRVENEYPRLNIVVGMFMKCVEYTVPISTQVSRLANFLVTTFPGSRPSLYSKQNNQEMYNRNRSNLIMNYGFIMAFTALSTDIGELRRKYKFAKGLMMEYNI